MTSLFKSITLGMAVLCLGLAGCGGVDPTIDPTAVEPVLSDTAAASLNLDSDEVRSSSTPSASSSANYDLEAVVYRLRKVAAPLFGHYGVTFGDDFEESGAFRNLLKEVSIVVLRGVVTVTNKATGGVIFRGSLNNLGAGVFTPSNIPGGSTSPPTACTYTTGAWGACQSNGSQTRTVTAAPSGCTGTAPASSQSCTYVPPVNGCSSFTYSAWAPAVCPASGQQSRSVASSLPAGCTGGSPVLSQSCTYVPPPTANPVTTANIVSSCTGCHGLTSNTTVYRSGGYSASGRSASQWLSTVNSMVNLGSSLAAGTTAQNYADFLAAAK
jgi:hypothetical protein